ncbi:50S ribosomal protein L4 [Thermospira aquatica]|uniref:Large ribosomal subunit protein uL4 n=1 Tax=Thermospira aquatica TaxID=2828656 RepID=A0AAX3BGB3_9SPIR|nr:50S ribosomal protein L4 [Thermospira aquatica]URA11325.1 50S ribosomal protein L4 [Thermospira aquatica]
MKLDVFQGNTKSGSLEVKLAVTDKVEATSEHTIYQAVVVRLANERQGTLSTLTKSEVRGGGKKPWRQKGLGRARAGSIRSPLWRGGGVTFGPKPRDFSLKINQKMKTKAYISVFSKMNELGRLKVITGFSYNEMKTKAFLKAFSAYCVDPAEKMVIITEAKNPALYLSTRNLPNVTVMYVDQMDILPLVYADRIYITDKALTLLDERYAKIFG